MKQRIGRVIAGIVSFAVVFMTLMPLKATAADAPQFTEYPAGSQVNSTAVAPDGSLWVGSVYTYLNHIDSSGNVTRYAVPSPMSNHSAAELIAVGVSTTGDVWATLVPQDYLAKLDPTTGQVTMYSLQQINPGPMKAPVQLVAGTNGTMWFFEGNNNTIAKITPDGTISEFRMPNDDSAPGNLMKAPDGSIWFTQPYLNRIAKIADDGSITIAYTIPRAGAYPNGLLMGPDGNFWFRVSGGKMAHMNLDGSGYAEVSTPALQTSDLALGPDGAFWGTQSGSGNDDYYVRVTTSGAVSLYTIPTPHTSSRAPAAAYGSIWYAEYNTFQIGRVSLVSDTTRPVVTVTPAAGATLQGTQTFNITITDSSVFDVNRNKAVWVYMYNTTGTQKSWGTKVDLSSGTGTFTIDTTKLNNGNANLDVGIVYDGAGNASGTSDNYFKNYTINN
jgi:streptogramin lyase